MAIKITPEGNNFYTVRVWAKHKDALGKRKTKQKKHIRTVAAAKIVAAEFEEQLSNPYYTDLTFKEVHNLYMEAKKEKISPTSFYSIGLVGNAVNKKLGHIKARNLNTRIVQQFIDELGKKKNANNPAKTIKSTTQLKHVNHIKAVLNWAEAREYIDFNKVKKIELKASEEFEPTIVDAKQIASILDYLKQYYYNIYIPILLLISTGARRGEALALKWHNVDFKRSVVNFHENRTMVGGNIVEKSKMKTTSSKRTSAMSDFLANELKQHKELQQGKSDYVCADAFNGNLLTPISLTRAFSRTMQKQFNIKMRLHDLRHSFNQLAYETNIDLTTRSKLLGHSNTTTTNKVYTHKSIEQNKKAVNIINNAFVDNLKNVNESVNDYKNKKN
jgi:integrase